MADSVESDPVRLPNRGPACQPVAAAARTLAGMV